MPESFCIRRNLPEMFRDTVQKYGQNTAISFQQKTTTFAELDQISDRVAAGLSQKGISKGDRVALYCINGDAFAAAYLGIVKAGATVIPINLLLTAPEIEYILNDAEARGIIYFDSFAPVVSQFRDKVPSLNTFVCIGQQPARDTDISWHAFLNNQAPVPEVTFEPENDLVSILYTSGTTGKPKGAMLTHQNLASNTTAALQAMHIIPGKDVILVVLPMFHAFAATVGMLVPMLHGACFVPVVKFDPELVADSIEKSKATIFLGVPSMYNVLLQSAAKISSRFASLRHCISGGAAMPQELMKRFEAAYNIAIYEGDGPTECSPVTCVNPINGTRKFASVGLPVPGVEMKICDEHGKELPANTIGEICVRAPSVMKGYWKRPEATAESFFDDWFRTGDLGTCDDDGYFYIVDRIKDMIIVNGMNVYPRAIEEVLYQHDAVSEAAVIGEPDDLHGEIVLAYIACKPGATLTSSEMRNFCREKLGRHQIPKKFIFVDSLPKNGAGKILKRELRKQGEIERGIDSRKAGETV